MKVLEGFPCKHNNLGWRTRRSGRYKGEKKKYCKTCKNARRKLTRSSLDIREDNLKHFHRMTLAEYSKKLQKQNNRCAICRRTETSKRNGKKQSLSVDHNHKTKRKRGLLCHRCNTALGLFRESLKILKCAIEYLEKYEKH